MKKVRELELAYARSQLELEVSKAQQLAEVEVNKFKQMTEALGPSTIRDLAVAGPEMQVRAREACAWAGAIPGTQGGLFQYMWRCWELKVSAELPLCPVASPASLGPSVLSGAILGSAVSGSSQGRFRWDSGL